MARDIRVLNHKDFTGGVNYRADAFELSPKESPDLLNVDVDPRGGVQLRQGVRPPGWSTANPNLLTLNEASMETDASGWDPTINVTLGTTTSVVAHGTRALTMTAASAASMAAVVGLRGGPPYIPVTAGLFYTAFAFTRAATTVRNCSITISWYDAGGGAISSSTSTPAANSTSEWRAFHHTVQAPPTATQVLFSVNVNDPANGEVHYVDMAQIAVGGNRNGWVHPSTNVNRLDGAVQRLFQFEKQDRTKVQLLAWTDRGTTPSTPTEAHTEGVIWSQDAGSNQWYSIGAYRECEAATFKDKIYFVGNKDNQGRIGFSWNGDIAVALGTAFNDDLTTPTGGNMPSAKYITSFQGCVWVAGTTESGTPHPNRVRWSHPNFPEDWRTFDSIDIDAGADGDVITGLVPFYDRLLVFKRKSIHAIVGTDPDNFQVYPVSRRVGATDQKAITLTNDKVYFFNWPGGVYSYDGKNTDWLFSRLNPLIEGGHLPEAETQDLATMGWSGRRVWLSLPWRENHDDSAPTENTRSYVLDPSLSKEGSWVVYDTLLGPKLLWTPTLSDNFFLSARPSTGKVLGLEIKGETYAVDNYGSGDLHITSYFRTPWYDLGQPAYRKRWRRPDIVLRAVNAVTELLVDVYRDYDPMVKRRQMTLHTTADNTMEWGDDWGDPWSGVEGGISPRSEIERGSPLGNCRAVQLVFNGPVTDHPWGLNHLALKYELRRLRS